MFLVHLKKSFSDLKYIKPGDFWSVSDTVECGADSYRLDKESGFPFRGPQRSGSRASSPKQRKIRSIINCLAHTQSLLTLGSQHSPPLNPSFVSISSSTPEKSKQWPAKTPPNQPTTPSSTHTSTSSPPPNSTRSPGAIPPTPSTNNTPSKNTTLRPAHHLFSKDSFSSKQTANMISS